MAGNGIVRRARGAGVSPDCRTLPSSCEARPITVAHGNRPTLDQDGERERPSRAAYEKFMRMCIARWSRHL